MILLMRFQELKFFLFAPLLLTSIAFAEGTPPSAEGLPNDLTEIGLKELLEFELVVTSPGRKKQSVSNVASAIHVLTSDDIRRSGVTHIAEALRLVPGVNVAQVSSSQWAVSIRGFNQVYANKLLVLLDGVSVFSPLTNGVYWETLDIVMGDVDRIEVIRGPGAALWGSNAVNGVVNIITKHSNSTRGGFITAGGGTGERVFSTVRYGAEIDNDTSARMSGRFTNMGDNRLRSGGNANDEWQIGSVNSRIDTNLHDGASLTVLGNAFRERDQVQPTTPTLQPPFIDSSTYSGTGHWQGGFGGVNYRKDFSTTSKFNILGSVVLQERESALIDLHYEVFEIDATHQIAPFDGHEVVYGGSLRRFDVSTNGTYAQDTIPSARVTERANWFLQDEIALDGRRLHLILGSKFEHNSSTGFEYMPTARLIWSPNDHHSVWGAVSRAVAPPAVVFEDTSFPVAAIPGSNGSPGTLITTVGDRRVSSEDVLAYEIGYRAQATSTLSFDATAFYNRYDNILTQEPGEPSFAVPNRASDPAVIVPLRFANGFTAQSLGGEFSSDYRALDWWKLRASYSYLSIRARQGLSQAPETARFIQGSAPRHTILVRSTMDLSDAAHFGLLGRYIDSLSLGGVSDYFQLDANITWSLSDTLSISVVGQNLLDKAHHEYLGNLFGPPAIDIRRAAFGTVTYRF